MATISNLSAYSYKDGAKYTGWGETAYVGYENGYGNMVMVWRFTIDKHCSTVNLTGTAEGAWAYAKELSYYLSDKMDDSRYINYIGTAGRLGSTNWNTTYASRTITLENVPAGTWYLYFCPADKNCLRSRVKTPTGSCAEAATYMLSTSIGTGSSMTVNRTFSHFASTGDIRDGSTLYSGDTLKITFAVSTGYQFNAHTVNGSTFTSGDTHTVTGNVLVVASASVLQYILSVAEAAGLAITVNRTGSPLKDADTGIITNGAAVYYGDILQVVYIAAGGYEVVGVYINSAAIDSGASHTVVKDVAITAETKMMATIRIGTGTSLKRHLIRIGGKQYRMVLRNGETWENIT